MNKTAEEKFEDELRGLWFSRELTVEDICVYAESYAAGKVQEIIDEIERNSNMYMKIIDGPDEIGECVVVDDRMWNKLKQELQ